MNHRARVWPFFSVGLQGSGRYEGSFVFFDFHRERGRTKCPVSLYVRRICHPLPAHGGPPVLAHGDLAIRVRCLELVRRIVWLDHQIRELLSEGDRRWQRRAWEAAGLVASFQDLQLVGGEG